MYFPVSGVEVNPIVPVITAFVISFFTSMGGVSGAFLLLPFQVSVLGFNTPSVSATNQLYNIVSIPGGIYRYIKEGRMVWPLAGVIVLGTLPGVFIGAFLRIQYLPDPRNFKFFAGLVLLFIGFKLLRELMKRDNGETKKKSAEQQFRSLVKNFNAKQEVNKQIPRVKIKSISISKIVYEFYGQDFDIKIAGITGISFIVGIVGGGGCDSALLHPEPRHQAGADIEFHP